MEAIFWIMLLLVVASKVELVGSQGLKNRKGRLFFNSLFALDIYFKIAVCSRSVILTQRC